MSAQYRKTLALQKYSKGHLAPAKISQSSVMNSSCPSCISYAFSISCCHTVAYAGPELGLPSLPLSGCLQQLTSFTMFAVTRMALNDFLSMSPIQAEKNVFMWHGINQSESLLLQTISLEGVKLPEPRMVSFT